MVAKTWCFGQRLWLSNLISFKGTWAFILAIACLCAGWRGAGNPHRLIYAIRKESPGPPVSADSSLLSLSLPREWGSPLVLTYKQSLDELACAADAPDSSSVQRPLGAVRDCLAFSVHLRGPLLVFQASRAVTGGDC